MEKPESPETQAQPQEPDQSSRPAAPAAPPPPPPEPGPPCPSPEGVGFPTHFARIFFGAITLLVLYYSYVIFKPYLVDFFLALVLFLTTRPLYNTLTRIFFGRRALASGVTCLLLALVILIPLSFLLSIIANQALEFSRAARLELQSGHLWQWVNAKMDALQAYLVHLNLPLPPEQVKLGAILQAAASYASEFIYTNSISLLRGFTNFLLDLVLVLFITFVMFLQGDDFIREVKKLSPLDAAHNEEIIQEMEVTIKATLWGTIIVAVVQGALGGVGFLIFGLPQPAFWGVVMIPAAVIPVVGSALIWGPAAVYLLFTGHVGAGVGLIIWGGVLVSVIDNILKPILMKGTGAMPGILILFSILGGIGYFGMVGFILGPLILSFLLALLRIYQKTILAPAPSPAPVAGPEKEKPISPAGDGS